MLTTQLLGLNKVDSPLAGQQIARLIAEHPTEPFSFVSSRGELLTQLLLQRKILTADNVKTHHKVVDSLINNRIAVSITEFSYHRTAGKLGSLR